jgi:endoglucanase
MTQYVRTLLETGIDDQLDSLLSLHAVSGHESELRNYIAQSFNTDTISSNTDALGNLILQYKGNGNTHVLLAAHMDEIGFMTRFIDEAGFVYIDAVGGVRAQNLYARQCTIKTHDAYIDGVINSIAPGRPNSDNTIPDIHDFYVDIGVDSADEAANLGVHIGQPVKPVYQFHHLHNKLAGTAFDDRALVFILASVLKTICQEDNQSFPDISAVFTTQEEVGSRGAQVAAHHLAPDYAIALDITLSNDIPKQRDSDMITKLGAGPAIKCMDNIDRAMLGLIVPEEMVAFMSRVATDHDIPYQAEVHHAGSTDGATIQLAGNGICTGGICLPTRYVHAYEMISKPDLINTGLLLYHTLQAFGATTPERF